jgi:hypothetical protein
MQQPLSTLRNHILDNAAFSAPVPHCTNLENNILLFRFENK